MSIISCFFWKNDGKNIALKDKLYAQEQQQHDIDMVQMAACEVGYAGWWCRSAGHGGNATEKSDN